MDSAAQAELLTARRPARFSPVADDIKAHVAEHGCAVPLLTPIEARSFEFAVRATHSSYVLQVGAGLGEATLHMAGAFGYTGRLDAIEPDPAHGTFIERQLRRFAFEETVRVHVASPANVVSALSGPYDLIVLHAPGPALDFPDLDYEDLVRLLRTGGSLLAVRSSTDAESSAAPPEGGLLARLAGDPRMLPWFAPDLTRVLATRAR